MKKRMMKAIKELNAYIDNDREKLCDELHNIKLSHKRLENLLRLSLSCMRNCFNYVPEGGDFEKLANLYVCINRELSYPYFRVNWKVKGGKDA